MNWAVGIKSSYQTEMKAGSAHSTPGKTSNVSGVRLCPDNVDDEDDEKNPQNNIGKKLFVT